MEFEKEIANKKLDADPEHVNSESSVRHLEGPGTRKRSEADGLVGDLVGHEPRPCLMEQMH